MPEPIILTAKIPDMTVGRSIECAVVANVL